MTVGKAGAEGGFATAAAVWLTALVLGLPLLGFAVAGLSARYVADDFCTASMLLDKGFLGAQETWYLTWTGRFGSTLVITTLDWLGAWTVPFTPAVLVLAWVVASVAAVRAPSPALRATSPRGEVLLALVLVTATLGAAPNLWESLYWQTGAVTYLLPLVLTTAYVATLFSRQGPWLAAGVLLIVLAVGCSETALAMLVCCLTLAWLANRRKPALRNALSAGLLAALVASAVLLLAPGNALRSAAANTFFEPPSPAVVVAGTLTFPFLQLFSFLSSAPAFGLLAYGVPFLLARCQHEGTPPRNARLMVIGAGLLTLAATGAPAIYVGGTIPPDRALVISQFVIVVMLLCCGFLDGRATRTATANQRRLVAWVTAVIATAVIVFGPLRTTVETVGQAAELRAYAAALDDVDRLARQAHADGDRAIQVPRVTTPALVTAPQLKSDPRGFPNTCVAGYYGLESIVAT